LNYSFILVLDVVFWAL